MHAKHDICWNGACGAEAAVGKDASFSTCFKCFKLRLKQKQQWSKGKGYKGYKDGLQPETLADGNWLVKQNQPVSKIAQAEAEGAVVQGQGLQGLQGWPTARDSG